MSKYSATVFWQRGLDEAFIDNRYSRAHQWQFDGGVVVPASASPSIVPEPHAVAANVDPEEAFVAALSSCHMLFFLSLAAKQQWQVERYQDNAEGLMAKNPQGRMAMTQVWLRPQALFAAGTEVTEAQLNALHHKAHELCFLANSVLTDILIEPVLP
ncbi:OsmC family protein [Pseudoalteromonas fenneropenaei]|uniref:OsmC family protein n=1 Tax=Pseudoalteromonas fenneropenaei TaxID=1737459 RepID=A0ABV7CJC4_9GAMM